MPGRVGSLATVEGRQIGAGAAPRGVRAPRSAGLDHEVDPEVEAGAGVVLGRGAEVEAEVEAGAGAGVEVGVGAGVGLKAEVDRGADREVTGEDGDRGNLTWQCSPT